MAWGLQRFFGTGLNARLLRSSAWSALGHVVYQAVRFGSNLILTRLLFPEAFGLMALIMVFVLGLEMFSDVGTAVSIQRSKNGDDPDFLNTAWTLQVIRGGLLWIACCAISWPVSIFYNEPFLAVALPVSGLTLLLSGLNPTKIQTATRHLAVGRYTILALLTQIISLVFSIVLAWWFRSTWALVVSGVFSAFVYLVLMTVFLEGNRNRFRWHKAALGELVTFGRWILLSTLCGFILTQGDKAVLGKYLTADNLGIYNIGFFLATFPTALAAAVTNKMLIPMYRERPPAASAQNYAKIRKARFALTGFLFILQLPLVFGGVVIVEMLYDSRFWLAGPIVVVMACLNIPNIITITYSPAALAAGDSQRHFTFQFVRATLYIAFFLFGVSTLGLVGAFLGQLAAHVATYPVLVWLARKHSAWDGAHDMIWFGAGLCLSGAALWINRGALSELSLL